jgi:DNA-binding transcriptional MerR regulator
MRIGELARRAGVTTKTVRFYGDIGLVAPRERTPSGYRVYDESALSRLRAIRLAKEAGLELDEIRRLVPVLAGDPVRCGDVLPLLRRKRREVEEQIDTLVHLRDYLDGSIAACRRAQRKGAMVACPVLTPAPGTARAAAAGRGRTAPRRGS